MCYLVEEKVYRWWKSNRTNNFNKRKRI